MLIGALATLAVWLVGKIAELKGLHRRFQPNTIKTRNVLSTFYLGCEVFASSWMPMSLVDFIKVIQVLREDRYAADLAA